MGGKRAMRNFHPINLPIVIALVMVRAINRSIKTSRCEKSEAELANASRDFLKRTRRRLMEALEWEILKSN